MSDGLFDPRAVANLVLRQQWRKNRTVSHIQIQKLLYFIQGFGLTKFNLKFIYGDFEAWQYGPVLPSLYRTLSGINSDLIQATIANIKSIDLKEDKDLSESERLLKDTTEAVLEIYGHLPARRLVDISHARGGPWDFVVEQSRKMPGYGLRIGDDVIRSRFGNQLSLIRTEFDGREELAKESST